MLLPALAAAAVPYTDCQQGEGSLHDFTLKTLDGSQDVALSDYQGKIDSMKLVTLDIFMQKKIKYKIDIPQKHYVY